MKRNKIPGINPAIPLLIVIGFLLVVIGCKKDDPPSTPSTEKYYELYLDFWNPDGNNPEISFDAEKSSPEIRIDFSQTFEGVAVPPNFTNIIIDNVRIIDTTNINYDIEDITAYEFRNDINDWKEDVEFIMEYASIVDLSVVLVLDASASLGDDFTNVKDFATNFINKIFTESPSANIGIVDFSDVINS